jgi:ABC-type multidrug transport system ATPase subunit
MSAGTDDALMRPSPAVVLQLDGLCFRYGQRVLLDQLSARILPGVTWVRGGDGRGKTTLLRLLAGAVQGHAGALWVNGTSLSAQPEAYRRAVFWVDPSTTEWDQTSARHYFNSLAQRYPRFDEALLADLLEGLSLVTHVEKPMYMLSTGSKRKVWLAAAFASGAPVVLLDEPFAALDKASIGCVLELLQEAAHDPVRAWVIADYEAPAQVPLAGVIALGD